MSLVQKLHLTRVSEFFQARSRWQLGAMAAGVSALAVGGYVLAPLLRIEASVIKGWILSIIWGPKEERLLKHVLKTAERGNPKSVIDTIDAWCWSTQWMMNVGDVKGIIVDEQVEKAKPMVAVELGGYCGYSAVRIASKLPPGAKFYTIELNAKYAEIATQIIKFAGLEDRCQILVGPSGEMLRSFAAKTGHNKIDFLFIDHAKQLYLPDIQTIQEVDLLRPGSVVVADNVIFPGTPDYLAHVRSNPHFKSTFYQAQLEYSTQSDGLEVSVYQ